MRTRERLRQHYLVERELAERLRLSKQPERSRLYGEVYDELFRRVPDHPQLTRKVDDHARACAVAERFALLRRFISAETIFLEVGAGDCSLARKVGALVRKCYALDVSEEIMDYSAGDDNVEPVLSDGCSIPLVPGSVTVAYSYQLMEHIHPEDAVEQLKNIFQALAPGGVYVCVTPNRLNGPHDVSRYFDDEARGFHLKEYTLGELNQLFRAAGFRRVAPYVGFSHRYFRVPLYALIVLERLLEALPSTLRRAIGNLRVVRNLLFISAAAFK